MFEQGEQPVPQALSTDPIISVRTLNEREAVLSTGIPVDRIVRLGSGQMRLELVDDFAGHVVIVFRTREIQFPGNAIGEKAFASLPSLERITAACRENRVGFMDATHFVRHPRYAAIRKGAAEMIGQPRSLYSRFLISLTDRNDIRYDPTLEPLGAIGDLGWYNMRQHGLASSVTLVAERSKWACR